MIKLTHFQTIDVIVDVVITLNFITTGKARLYFSIIEMMFPTR